MNFVNWKKILLVFFFFFLAAAAFSRASWAQTQDTGKPWAPSFKDIENAQTKQSASLENLTGANLLLNGQNILIGAIGTPSEPNSTSSSNGGTIGFMNSMVLAMMQKPGNVSSVEYLADLGNNLGVIPKEAYAQGTGFVSLAPVLTIWKAIRDFVYLIYVVVFFIVGFMILMRKKIDPRTVISVETALPKLIIALILITFSYAIIGFMVDIANLASRVIAGFFVGKILLQSSSSPEQTNFINQIFSSNIFYLVRPIGDVFQIAEHAQNATMGSWAGPFVYVTTALIFGFAVLFITFKIFFALLGPYVGIILSIIFAPFEILMTTIPGNEASITNWIKNVMAKIAVFPVVFFLLLIAASFGAYNPNSSGLCFGDKNCFNWQPEKSIKPSLSNNLNLVMAPFGNWSPVIGDLIAFGILFTIPATAQLVQNALKVKDQTADIASQTIRRGMSKVPGLKGLAEG